MHKQWDLPINRVVDLLIYVYGSHTKANTPDQDGKPCYKCKEAIPLIYPTKISKQTGRCFVKVDRGNRVDVELRHQVHGIKLVSYHIECWRSLIFI